MKNKIDVEKLSNDIMIELDKNEVEIIENYLNQFVIAFDKHTKENKLENIIPLDFPFEIKSSFKKRNDFEHIDIKANAPAIKNDMVTIKKVVK